MKFLMTLMMWSAAAAAVAQTVPSRDVETVRSGIGEEALAPIPVSRTLPAASTMPAGTAAAAVSSSEVADPFTVKGVVVTLSGTTGFDRDSALEQGARQALPGVLVSMGMDTAEAAKTVKSLGNAMKFVKGFKVVKETLIPSYVLTADMSFNGPMLQKNFGGKIPAPKAVSGTETVAAVSSSQPVSQWVVRIVERDPATVDRVRVKLAGQPNTKVVYRLVTSLGAELLVETPMGAGDISGVAGIPVVVTAVEVVPNVVPQAEGRRPWQGQEEPASPAAPNEPSAPDAPADPNGGRY